jgi:hypothetical protein
MAIPTSGGSEILQRGWFENLSTAAQYALFTGAVANTTDTNAVPAHTIVTLLNFRATNMGAAEELLNIYVKYGGSTTIFLAYLQPVPSNGTFVLDEKVVLHATDQLIFNTDSVGTTDVSYNFIVQDWT